MVTASPALITCTEPSAEVSLTPPSRKYMNSSTPYGSVGSNRTLPELYMPEGNVLSLLGGDVMFWIVLPPLVRVIVSGGWKIVPVMSFLLIFAGSTTSCSGL